MTASHAKTSRHEPMPMNENPHGSRPWGKSSDADAQAAVGAELHHHAGEQHGSSCRRGNVARGRPGVERPHASKNRKTDKDQRKTPHLKVDRQARVRESGERCRVAARGGVGRKQADEDHGRADEGIERELHGAVFATRGAPDGDEKVFRNDGDFVEHKKQEEIAA